MKEGALKNTYIEDLSKWTRMELDAIRRELLNTSSEAYVPQKKQNTKKWSKLSIIETRLLYLSLLSKQNFDKIFNARSGIRTRVTGSASP